VDSPEDVAWLESLSARGPAPWQVPVAEGVA
jgi:hypothetical protein